MGSSRLLWPVCGPALADRAVTDHRDDLFAPMTWGFSLERAKGIEPS
jgi:hypothetical protein